MNPLALSPDQREAATVLRSCLRATDVHFDRHTAVEAGLPTLVFVHGFGASLRTWEPSS